VLGVLHEYFHASPDKVVTRKGGYPGPQPVRLGLAIAVYERQQSAPRGRYAAVSCRTCASLRHDDKPRSIAHSLSQGVEFRCSIVGDNDLEGAARERLFFEKV
jgi:hypothetical protein